MIVGDSFVVSDSPRAPCFACANRATYDVPFDPARVVEERSVALDAVGAPAGVVKLGTGWLLLETR